MDTLIKEYIDYKKSQGMSDKTIESYTFALTNRFDLESMVDFNAVELEEHLYEMKEDYADATLQSSISALKGFCEYLEKRNERPFKFKAKDVNIKLKRGPKKPPLTAADQILLAEGLQGDDYLIYKLLVDTGVRVSEYQQVYAAIKDADRPELLLPPYGIQIVGKGNKPRTIFVTQEIIDLVLKNDKDADWWTIRKIEYRVSKWNDEFNLSIKVTPHTARRTFATNWCNKGGEPAMLQMVMGHEDISTTMGYVTISTEAAGQEYEDVIARGINKLKRNELLTRIKYLEGVLEKAGVDYE